MSGFQSSSKSSALLGTEWPFLQTKGVKELSKGSAQSFRCLIQGLGWYSTPETPQLSFIEQKTDETIFRKIQEKDIPT